jgi:hypothetical protein
MRAFSSLIVLVLAIGAWPSAWQPPIVAAPVKQTFDGGWWLKSDLDERSGFLDGAADYMTWTAHKKGFSATPSQIMGKIDRFYKSHPGSASLDVIDVWQKVAGEPEGSKSDEGQGEIWKNAHWYLNGDWWSQVSEAEQLGFVEGYLWCMRTQIPAPIESYVGTASSYRRRIDAFVRANPKLGKEAVATTLQRYQDGAGAADPR